MPCHADEVSYSGLSFSVVNETWMFTTASQNDWSESANEKSKLRQTNQLRRRKLTPVNKLSVLSLPHWPHCSFHIPFTFPKFHEKEFNLPKKILHAKACPEERTPLTGTFCWQPFVPSLQWQLVVAVGMDPGSWRLDDGAQQLGPREKVCQEKGA